VNINVFFKGPTVTEGACLQLRVGARSDIGRVRKNNEDTFLALTDLHLFVISDGMGGEAHGELASAIAGDTIAAYCSGPSDDDPLPGEYSIPGLSSKTNRLARAIHLANRKIYDAAVADPSLRGMGATVVAVWLHSLRLSVVHVGDSRAYLLHDGQLQVLTADHTLVAEQVRRGLIKPEEAHSSKMQNVLIRALGAQSHIEPDVSEQELQNDDVLLLCTDGLTRMVSDKEIAAELLKSAEPQVCADNLISLANQHGGEDNVSVIVVRIAETA
jgi:serine/threonine protein phosphatase PrpC